MQTNSLCAHANILSIHFEIDKQCGCTALRLATLLESHPLTNIGKRCAKRRVKHHKSPPHHLANFHRMDPGCFETIPSAGRNSALIGKKPFKVTIPPSKEDSEMADAQAPEHITVYTDGSAHYGKVGEAAILIRNGIMLTSAHYHLGAMKEHTVFKVEPIGLLLGLIKTHPMGNFSFSLGIDNQAAIKALSSKLNKLGHHIVAKFLNALAKLRKNKR